MVPEAASVAFYFVIVKVFSVSVFCSFDRDAQRPLVALFFPRARLHLVTLPLVTRFTVFVMFFFSRAFQI